MGKLSRSLGFWELTLIGTGIILGAGIYVLIGQAAGLGGNMLWLSFIIAGIVASLTGLSYAELSSMFPKAGAEFVYAEEAFNKRFGFVIGWLLLVTPVISAAAVTIGFAGYFNAFFGTPIILTAIGALAVFSLIVFKGVKTSARFAVLCSLIEIFGLILIIVLAIPFLGSVDYFEVPFELGFTGVFMAASLIFFAFVGFESIANMAEEAKNPTKIVPKAIIMAVIISTTLYILVGISAVSVLDWQVLGESTAPLADVAAVSLGMNAFIILGVVALFATANTSFLILLTASRMAYGMAKGNALPGFIGKLHSIKKTPWIAIVILFIASSFFVLIGDIGVIANMTNVTILSTFAIINASVIVLRYKKPNLQRKFKTPLNLGDFPILAFLGALSCILLVSQIDTFILLFGMGVIVLGLGLSFVFIKTPKSKLKN